MKTALLSTVVVPDFSEKRTVVVEPVNVTEYLGHVDRNYCGHPVTDRILREIRPDLPPAERGGKWDGVGYALAIRPRDQLRSGS